MILLLQYTGLGGEAVTVSTRNNWEKEKLIVTIRAKHWINICSHLIASILSLSLPSNPDTDLLMLEPLAES